MKLFELGTSLNRIINEDGADLNSDVVRAWVRIDVGNNKFHTFDYKSKHVCNDDCRSNGCPNGEGRR